MATKQKKIGGKRYDAIFKTVEKLKPYTVEEAIELAKKTPPANLTRLSRLL